MPFELPRLPYPSDALAPHITRETLETHHGKHHRKYVDTLNELTAGTQWESLPLEAIVRKAEPGPLFDNAAQHWNHSFYWKCLSPDGGGEPPPNVAEPLGDAFGSVSAFRTQFSEAAEAIFGSGWAWLVRGPNRKLTIECTRNADNPLPSGRTPLLTCDLWEHAYYLDYRNAKSEYLNAFWKVVNWDFLRSGL